MLACFSPITNDSGGPSEREQRKHKHRWMYFPEVRKHELIFLKQYDSLPGAKQAFHSLFADPTAPAGSPKQEYVEVHVIAMFDDMSQPGFAVGFALFNISSLLMR